MSFSMNSDIEPLPFYKEPMYYTGLVALVFVGLFIYSIFGGSFSSNWITVFILATLVFGGLTYLMWKTKCPKCKRPFVKKEKPEWKEDLGIRKEPYKYHSKIYQYSDGTTEKVPGSEKTIMRNRKYDRHYYICKKCGHGSGKEWDEKKGKWLGEEPKPKIIKVKGDSAGFGLDEDKKSNKKKRVPIKTKVKREIFERADNTCQHCGENTALDIHHIDENPSNNRKNNLIVLCPNCHRKTKSIPKNVLKNEALKPYKKSKTINIYKK